LGKAIFTTAIFVAARVGVDQVVLTMHIHTADDTIKDRILMFIWKLY
jgi:hypothetical protein